MEISFLYKLCGDVAYDTVFKATSPPLLRGSVDALKRDLTPVTSTAMRVCDAVLRKKPGGRNIEVSTQRIGREVSFGGYDQISRASNPLINGQCCDAGKQRVWRKSPRLSVDSLESPRKPNRISAEVQPLIRLISADYVKRSLQTGAKILLQKKGSVRAAQETSRAGNLLEAVVGSLLASVVYDNEAKLMLISKALEATDGLIVAAIAVRLARETTDSLEGVDDNQPRIRIDLQKGCKLLKQSARQLLGGDGKVQVDSGSKVEHSRHTSLEALVRVFKGQIQHRALTGLILPKGSARTDTVGNLGSQKRLADFRCTCKQVKTGKEEFVDYWWSDRIGGVIKLFQRNRRKKVGVGDALKLALKLRKVDLDLVDGI